MPDGVELPAFSHFDGGIPDAEVLRWTRYGQRALRTFFAIRPHDISDILLAHNLMDTKPQDPKTRPQLIPWDPSWKAADAVQVLRRFFEDVWGKCDRDHPWPPRC